MSFVYWITQLYCCCFAPVCRGCILYAMVCGRLPFGDDSQVAKNVAKPLNFPVPLTEGIIIAMRLLGHSRSKSPLVIISLLILQTART